MSNVVDVEKSLRVAKELETFSYAMKDRGVQLLHRLNSGRARLKKFPLWKRVFLFWNFSKIRAINKTRSLSLTYYGTLATAAIRKSLNIKRALRKLGVEVE